MNILYIVYLLSNSVSIQVRDKEEELENSLQKIDTLRQDIRKAEKLRRELEVSIKYSVADPPDL